MEIILEYVASLGKLSRKSVSNIGGTAVEFGLSGVELPAPSREKFDELAGNVQRLRDEFGISTPIVTHECAPFTEEAESLYRLCGEAGVRFIQPKPFALGSTDWWDSFEDAILEVGWFVTQSEEFGVKTLIPISYGNSLITTALSAWMLASYTDPSFVCIAYDPGYLVIDGEDEYVGLNILREYLGVVRVRNCATPVSGIAGRVSDESQFYPAPLDTGVVSWKKLLGALRSIGYVGIIALSETSVGESNIGRDVEYLKSICNI